MKKLLIVLISFAFVSGSFANDLSKSVKEKESITKIEQTLQVLNSDVDFEVISFDVDLKDEQCSATIDHCFLGTITISSDDCAQVAVTLTYLVSLTDFCR